MGFKLITFRSFKQVPADVSALKVRIAKWQRRTDLIQTDGFNCVAAGWSASPLSLPELALLEDSLYNFLGKFARIIISFCLFLFTVGLNV